MRPKACSMHQARRRSRRRMPGERGGPGGSDRRATDDQVALACGGLVVLAPRRATTRHGLADVRRVVIAGEITQRHNADQPLVAIDDWQAPYPGLAHVARHLVD